MRSAALENPRAGAETLGSLAFLVRNDAKAALTQEICSVLYTALFLVQILAIVMHLLT